jgi:hypothetical protein
MDMESLADRDGESVTSPLLALRGIGGGGRNRSCCEVSDASISFPDDVGTQNRLKEWRHLK